MGKLSALTWERTEADATEDAPSLENSEENRPRSCAGCSVERSLASAEAGLARYLKFWARDPSARCSRDPEARRTGLRAGPNGQALMGPGEAPRRDGEAAEAADCLVDGCRGGRSRTRRPRDVAGNSGGIRV
eukprot:CAMPEP_0172634124 /NCGR_PEP_ID=MMETSP1068-20121228/193018_1 /TAXON_ID=35684 /ORGANISM="Pseudopedinella elastica, Strain CCMP716" /LENGTH=131 /DNA_ID=CAMNT_0013446001 /DNA_START=679 /DNA_END=1076 /DNA_ORIENTATION=+